VVRSGRVRGDDGNTSPAAQTPSGSSEGEQLIVHLVNPPATERVVIDGKQAREARKDLLVLVF
jgi:hypothetical protein